MCLLFSQFAVKLKFRFYSVIGKQLLHMCINLRVEVFDEVVWTGTMLYKFKIF